MARLLASVLLLGSALAQNLLALAPQGAVAGFQLSDLRNSRYLAGLAQDWKSSGLETLLKRELQKEVGGQADLLGIAAGGVAAALYRDGFFLIARPSPAALQAVRRETRGVRPEGGWLVGGDSEVLTGISRELVFLASPKYARLFLQGRRGLQAPARGDIVLWGALPQDLVRSLGLPPRTQSALSTFRRFSYALQLTPGGYTDESRLELNPGADPTLAALLLPKERPFDAGNLPQGYAVTSGVFDLGRLGAYLPGLLREFDLRLNLDLRAFGTRFATVSVQGPPPAPDALGEGLLGHSLIYWEVRDPVTAEANLLALLQTLAAFATPQGQGGFRMLGNEGGFKAVEVGLMGKLYYRLEANRLVLATSESALQATHTPPWNQNPDFRRFRVRIPAGAVGYTFSQQGVILQEQATQLARLLPQAIGSSGLEGELVQSLASFTERLAKRFGAGLSYTVVEGNALVTRGFYEVRW